MSTAEMIRTEPRLLANLVQRRPAGLAAHLERHGPLPVSGVSRPEFTRSFLVEVERSGLTGRGGAGFPTATKLHLVRTKRAHPVLLANAMEGEPASAKDRLLLESAPHLVLDGAELAALALNAGRIVLCLPAERRDLSERLVAAVEARRRSGYSAAPIEIALLAGHYVAGEESALASAVGEDAGLPQFRPDKSVPLTIGRRPVLVHNVETLAHLGLIARHGADWFRRIGAPEAPGTCLVTISGSVAHPGVREVATGTPIGEILATAKPFGQLQAVLVGGYGGTWISGRELTTPYAPGELARLRASMGAGVLIALGQAACAVREVARIARFLATASAGQCGPCLYGLPAIAVDLDEIAGGRASATTVSRLEHRLATVNGRGACRHPDGAVRMVRSALQVFRPHLRAHLGGTSCVVADTVEARPWR